MLSGVFSSTIRTVVGSQFIREVHRVEFPSFVCDHASIVWIVVLQHFAFFLKGMNTIFASTTWRVGRL